MRRTYFIMGAIVFICGCALAQAPREKASASVPEGQPPSFAQNRDCDLQAPPNAPKDAYPVYMEGGAGIFFRYPNSTPKDYAGCQILWVIGDKGREARFVIHFVNGIPDSLKTYEKTQLLASCKLHGKETDEPEKCANMDSFVKLLIEAKPYKGEIPKDIDPRK